MFLILFVLHDTDHLDRILNGWEAAGVKGITILPSTGLGRIRQWALQESLPLIPSIDDMIMHTENLNRTIFSIVDDEAMVDRVLAETKAVTGDLNLPYTGILVVLPVVRAYGLSRKDD